jgi:integrase/recombinase XerD
MKLTAAIDMYVLHRQTAGERFQGPFVALRAFSRRYGNRSLRAITPAEVKQFLDVPRTGPATWRRKYGTLRDFFAYWRCRGKLNTVPMPPTAPKYTQTFVPYIYSHRELRLLLEAVPHCLQNVECRISAATLRTLLLFLYGTGMRVGEALSSPWCKFGFVSRKC